MLIAEELQLSKVLKGIWYSHEVYEEKIVTILKEEKGLEVSRWLGDGHWFL